MNESDRRSNRGVMRKEVILSILFCLESFQMMSNDECNNRIVLDQVTLRGRHVCKTTPAKAEVKSCVLSFINLRLVTWCQK